MCIISEYMSKGSLYSIMRTYEKEGKQLERKLQRTIAISVARGMAYLHTRSPPILHLVRMGRGGGGRCWGQRVMECLYLQGMQLL